MIYCVKFYHLKSQIEVQDSGEVWRLCSASPSEVFFNYHGYLMKVDEAVHLMLNGHFSPYWSLKGRSWLQVELSSEHGLCSSLLIFSCRPWKATAMTENNGFSVFVYRGDVSQSPRTLRLLSERNLEVVPQDKLQDTNRTRGNLQLQ